MANDAMILGLMLENIDRASWILRDDVVTRVDRILQLAELSGVQPDAHLSRIIKRVRGTLNILEETLSKVEAMKPAHLEAAE